MSKSVQILLSKQLTVNLGRDEHGEAKTVVLNAGLQEVEQEIAEHWFVKAHSQEITSSDTHSHGLQVALDAANTELTALKEQSAAADEKIAEMTKQAAADAKTIENLKTQLAKAQQAPAADEKPVDPKAK